MGMPKTGDVLFLEHQKTASYQIWLQIPIPHPSFTLNPVKTDFLLHINAENRRSSIFGTSKNGVTPNLTSDSDSPSLIYPKTVQNRFFITGKCRKPAKFYFWNIKKRRHTKSDLKFGFPVLHLPIFDPSYALILFLIPITHIFCKTPVFFKIVFDVALSRSHDKKM